MTNSIDINHREMFLECSCGCSFLKIDCWGDIIFLSHNISSFQALQDNNWERFKKTLKIIWYLIRGKEYTFYEIALDTKLKVKEFKEFVAQIDESLICEY